MFCKYCGNELEEDDKFCPKCGKEVKRVEMDGMKKNEEKENADSYGVAVGKKKLETVLLMGTEENRFERKKLMKWLKIFLAAVLIIFIGYCIFRPQYTCDNCGKKTTKAYGDMFDDSMIFCADCAEEYYMGMNIENYNLKGDQLKNTARKQKERVEKEKQKEEAREEKRKVENNIDEVNAAEAENVTNQKSGENLIADCGYRGKENFDFLILDSYITPFVYPFHAEGNAITINTVFYEQESKSGEGEYLTNDDGVIVELWDKDLNEMAGSYIGYCDGIEGGVTFELENAAGHTMILKISGEDARFAGIYLSGHGHIDY